LNISVITDIIIIEIEGDKEMKNGISRTITCSFNTVHGYDSFKYEIKKMVSDILVDGMWCNAWFYTSKEDGKLMVEVATLAIGEMYSKWTVLIPFKKEFTTKEEGNEFYKKLMATKKISKKGNEYYTLPN
jgi:hypothetical protein